ncbi:winged helix-turn-helix transcriptional regulator [Streptomyces sp. NPDC002143]
MLFSFSTCSSSARPAFSELHAALPALSKRVLSDRLTELKEVGLVERKVSPGPPVAVTYRLTERGMGLGPAMDALRVWAGAPVDDLGRPLPHTDADEHEAEPGRA